MKDLEESRSKQLLAVEAKLKRQEEENSRLKVSSYIVLLVFYYLFKLISKGREQLVFVSFPISINFLAR